LEKSSLNKIGVITAIALIFGITAVIGYVMFPDNVFFEFVWIPGAIIIAICVLVMIPQLIKHNRIDSLPKLTTSAKVITKTSAVSKGYGENQTINTIYYVAFQFPDNSRNNFCVDINTYNTVIENDTGLLTYKQSGNNLFFVSFEPQS